MANSREKASASDYFAKVRRVIGIFSRTPYIFALVWKANPTLSFLLVGSDISMGLIPIINVWVLKCLVDAIPRLVPSSRALSLQPGTPGADVAFALSLLALSWFGFRTLQPLSRYCREQLNDFLSRDINLMILDKLNSGIDIAILENPKFYDSLQKLQNEMAHKPVQMLIVTSQFAKSAITFFSLSVILSTLNPSIIVLVIVLSVPNIVFQLKVAYEMWHVFDGDAPELRRMRYYMQVLTNNAEGKEVKLFGLAPYFRSRYSESFAGFQQRRADVRRAHLLWSALLSFVSAFGIMGAYVYAIMRAAVGAASSGSMAMYIGAISQLESTLTDLAFYIAEFYQHSIFIKHLQEFLEIPQLIPRDQSGQEAVPRLIRHGIEFKNVSFKYPHSSRYVFKNLSFQIDAGSTVAIVGDNGAGKTTIVKLLARLYDPSEGQILIDGIDLRNLNAEKWRERMSVVFQDYCRFQMSLQENIGVGNVQRMTNMSLVESSAQRAGASAIAEKLPNGYKSMLGKMFDEGTSSTELSGGEWQKVALARAFMRSGHDRGSEPLEKRDGEAQLLILDEPTASLDVQSEHEIYQQFFELTRGKTAILISHRFSTVRIADNILVLENGTIKEEGTHDQLITAQGDYARLYNLQADRYR